VGSGSEAKFGDEGSWFVASVDLLDVSDKGVACGRSETLTAEESSWLDVSSKSERVSAKAGVE